MSLIDLVAFLVVIGLSYWAGFSDGESSRASLDSQGK